MRQDYTDIVIVLDRSGSMQSTAADVVGGFNTFIQQQKEQPGELRVTMMQFDDLFDMVYQGTRVQDVSPLRFEPRGSTALYDAIGRTIADTGARLRQMPEAERPAKVLFVVITDGGENASKEYTQQRVFDMIKHQEDCYNWTFVYIGANQNAFSVGSGMGFKSSNTMNYAANSQGTRAVYRGLSAKTSSIRAGGQEAEELTKSSFFNATDYDEQTNAGAQHNK